MVKSSYRACVLHGAWQCLHLKKSAGFKASYNCAKSCILSVYQAGASR